MNVTHVVTAENSDRNAGRPRYVTDLPGSLENMSTAPHLDNGGVVVVINNPWSRGVKGTFHEGGTRALSTTKHFCKTKVGIAALEFAIGADPHFIPAVPIGGTLDNGSDGENTPGWTKKGILKA